MKLRITFNRSIIRKLSVLVTFILLPLATCLGGDCLDSFQSDMVDAGNDFEAAIAAADSSWDLTEAGVAYDYDVGLAASQYDNCCGNGGSGCP